MGGVVGKVAVVGVVALILVATIFLVLSRGTKQNPQQVGRSIASSVPSQTNTNSRVTTSNMPTSIKTFRDSQIVVKYPSNWDAKPTSVPGANMIVFAPQSAGSVNAITVFTSAAAKDAPSEKAEFYKQYGLHEGTGTVSGVAAIKLSGTSTVGAPSTTQRETVYATIYLFQHNNLNYEIRNQYAGSTPNAELDTVFSQFVTSFKLP